jgi:hypothetical protein
MPHFWHFFYPIPSPSTDFEFAIIIPDIATSRNILSFSKIKTDEIFGVLTLCRHCRGGGNLVQKIISNRFLLLQTIPLLFAIRKKFAQNARFRFIYGMDSRLPGKDDGWCGMTSRYYHR